MTLSKTPSPRRPLSLTSREAFDAEGEAEVADLDDFLAECIVDEGPIGKGVEFAVRMFPTKFQDVRFADQRFAASEEVEMAAYFFALAYDFIHDIVGQVQGVTIFGSPAADAVQVAGAGRVEEDGPGNIAVIFGFGFVPRTQTVEARFKAQVHDGCTDYVGVECIQGSVEELEPLAAFVNELVGIGKRFFFK